MPLPVQALDHATGYLMAAAVVHGLTRQLATRRGFEAKASLARTAALLIDSGEKRPAIGFEPAGGDDWAPQPEATAFGPAHRLRPPVQIGASAMYWESPAVALGSSPAEW